MADKERPAAPKLVPALSEEQRRVARQATIDALLADAKDG